MEFTVEEYREQLVNEALAGANSGLTPEAMFKDTVLELLEGIGELENPFDEYFGKYWGRRKMSIDGYSIDEVDRELTLFLIRFDVEERRLNKSDLDDMFSQMHAFIEAVYDGSLASFCDDSNFYAEAGKDLRDRMLQKYVNDGKEDDRISKIRLLVITNDYLAVRQKSYGAEDFHGLPLEKNVWSIERLFEYAQSGKEREAIEIDFSDFGYEGLQFVKADFSGSADYDGYLCVFPGKLLASLYEKHGSRLLEGNVRSFLSTRGKVNAGIRKTILNDPTAFFAYNNGIACTAEEVGIGYVGNQQRILKVKDLQIINGGQTTASLFSAKAKDRAPLDNIFVPAKITVLHDNEKYSSTIENIARYANSQNSIKASDFFANHPFHQKFEEMSNRILPLPTESSLVSVYWYYERSRGKYNQEYMLLKTEGARKEFERKHPKDHRITKEDLAKYFNTINCKPYSVANGSVKNMAAFASTITDDWESKQDSYTSEYFFKKMIAAALLYRKSDKILRTAPWYKVTGFVTSIIPYAIGKIIAKCPEGREIDWMRIWDRQDLYPSLRQEVEKALYHAYSYILDHNTGVVSEFAKKKDNWTRFLEEPYDLNDDFVSDLISSSLAAERAKASSKDQKETKSLNTLIDLFSIPREKWEAIKAEAIERKIVGHQDIQLLDVMIKGWAPSAYQTKLLNALLKRLSNAGMILE